ATLYHLVAGKPPFASESLPELITLHETAARPTVPRGSHPRTAIAAIDALVARMMAPRPEDRFADHDELLRAIEQASLQHTRPAGLWVRGIASLVDLVLVALVSTLASNLLLDGRDVYLGEILAVAFAYTTLAVGRWRTTIGKALFELEVVTAGDGRR